MLVPIIPPSIVKDAALGRYTWPGTGPKRYDAWPQRTVANICLWWANTRRDPIGPGLCKILHPNFREFAFHAVSILEDGCGRRLGAA
jgi:hypothetical protein